MVQLQIQMNLENRILAALLFSFALLPYLLQRKTLEKRPPLLPSDFQAHPLQPWGLFKHLLYKYTPAGILKNPWHMGCLQFQLFGVAVMILICVAKNQMTLWPSVLGLSIVLLAYSVQKNQLERLTFMLPTLSAVLTALAGFGALRQTQSHLGNTLTSLGISISLDQFLIRPTAFLLCNLLFNIVCKTYKEMRLGFIEQQVALMTFAIQNQPKVSEQVVDVSLAGLSEPVECIPIQIDEMQFGKNGRRHVELDSQQFQAQDVSIHLNQNEFEESPLKRLTATIQSNAKQNSRSAVRSALKGSAKLSNQKSELKNRSQKKSFLQQLGKAVFQIQQTQQQIFRSPQKMDLQEIVLADKVDNKDQNPNEISLNTVEFNFVPRLPDQMSENSEKTRSFNHTVRLAGLTAMNNTRMLNFKQQQISEDQQFEKSQTFEKKQKMVVQRSYAGDQIRRPLQQLKLNQRNQDIEEIGIDQFHTHFHKKNRRRNEAQKARNRVIKEVKGQPYLVNQAECLKGQTKARRGKKGRVWQSQGVSKEQNSLQIEQH